MNCTNPKILWDMGKNQEPRWKYIGTLPDACERFGKSPGAIWSDRHALIVPCRQCLACKQAKGKEWGARVWKEAQQQPPEECWFLTLTYKPERLPWIKRGEETPHRGGGGIPTLYHKDFQDFVKRLRRKLDYHGQGRAGQMRYVMCGEYGSKTERPHYHACIMGLPLEDKGLQIIRVDPKSLQPAYKSEWLEEIWGNGLVDIEPLTPENAQYMAGYTVKKLYGTEAVKRYDAQGRKRPYIVPSKGIALNWLIEHIEEAQAGKYAYIPKNGGGCNTALPSEYERRKLKEGIPGICEPKTEDEIEAERLQTYEDRVAKERARLKQTTTDIITYNQIKERAAKERRKHLKNGGREQI